MYEKWYALYVRVISMFRTRSRRIGFASEFKKRTYFNAALEKNGVNLVRMPFEFMTIPVSGNYHEVLSSMYGEYMKFPPVAERGNWHVGGIVYAPDIPYVEYLRNHVND